MGNDWRSYWDYLREQEVGDVTDKERLEEIKENAMRNRAHYKTVGTNESYWGYSYELSDKDYTWLIEQAERVQELEVIIYQDARQGMLESLYEENKRYRGALEFYADLKNWRKTHTERVNNSPSKVIADTGERAREALESESE